MLGLQAHGRTRRLERSPVDLLPLHRHDGWLRQHDVPLEESDHVAGDTLHGQRNALDSGWVLDVTQDYSDPDNQPVRWLAEGRDPSATIDAAAGGFGKNDGDNEITGTEASDGDTSVRGLLGDKNPHLFQDKDWRFFYTEQHGDNRTYEVVPAP